MKVYFQSRISLGGGGGESLFENCNSQWYPSILGGAGEWLSTWSSASGQFSKIISIPNIKFSHPVVFIPMNRLQQTLAGLFTIATAMSEREHSHIFPTRFIPWPMAEIWVGPVAMSRHYICLISPYGSSRIPFVSRSHRTLIFFKLRYLIVFL